MKKKMLVQRLSEKSGPSKKKIYSMVNFLIEKMKESINSEDGLKVSGFGTFKRKGKRIIFKPSRKLLERLNSKKKSSKM